MSPGRCELQHSGDKLGDAMALNPKKSPKDPSLVKLPPQSIEAEESILSAILLDNSTLLDVIEILTAEDFYRTAHQKIFAAIETLFKKSEPVDLITLANALREANGLDEVGGAAYLAHLVDTVPSAINVTHYARIVRDKSALRRLIAKSGEITQRCFEDSGKSLILRKPRFSKSPKANTALHFIR